MDPQAKTRYLQIVNRKTGEISQESDVTNYSDHNRAKLRAGIERNLGVNWFVKDTGENPDESADDA